MKSIKTATLTILSVGLLAATTAFAAPTTSADGFLVLTVEEAPKAQAKAAAKPRAVKQVKRTQRVVKRNTKKKVTSKKARYYRVKRGDTLTRIAAKNGVRFSTIVRLNRLYGSKKNRINVGQRLRLR